MKTDTSISLTPPPSLDDLVAMVKEVMRRRMPSCDWASIIFHNPAVPETVITVQPDAINRRPAPAPSA